MLECNVVSLMPDRIALISAPALPLWAYALLGFVVPALSLLLGWGIGRRSYFERGLHKSRPEATQGEATLNALLALLGLLLAFSFGFALSRADARKTTQVEEAAAISTAFLRADLLQEPGRSALREAIGAYARTRYSKTNIGRSDAALAEFMQHTLEAQNRLWPTTLAALQPDTSAAIVTNVTSGITEVLDAHTRRVAAGLDGVPMIARVMVLLYAATALGVK
ncbi:MAG: hypothetical protein COW54_10305 [Rhodobacteraceae bacterium CG17_big_fil_post_rev_8_21_14_2_50_63_15]|nr:MAG: hypothetical protein COW54_10305 [Rhodobacteraceae bacterium CG17_big_fil_post_rev_8_21_14_2_50_63_15]